MRKLDATRPILDGTGEHARRARTAILAAALSVAAIGAGVAPAGALASKKAAKGYTVKASSGKMTLTFTASVWASLNSGLGRTVGKAATPVAPATGTSAGVLSFPITRGSLNSATGRGTVYAQGGLTIESHLSIGGLFESSSSATASSPAVSLGSTSKITLTSANFSPPNIPLITLGTGHVKTVGSRHAVSLSKIPAALTAPGAQFFGSGFTAGQQIGTVTIQIKG